MKSLYLLLFINILLLCCATVKLSCSKSFSIDISSAVHYANTSEVLQKDNVVYNKTDYFLDGDGKKWGCICNIKKCIKTCCGENHIYKPRSKKCIPSNVFNVTSTNSIHLQHSFMVNDSTCPAGYVKIQEYTSQYEIFENGSLYYPEWEMVYSLDQYCVDKYSTKPSVFFCEPNENEEAKRQVINGIGMMISMPFLFVTFLVYFILPERNLHRRALMCYIVTILGAFITVVIINFYPKTFEEVSCHILGYLTIYFFLVSFFWLNVMCLDMFLAFRSSLGFLSKHSTERKKNIIYSIYAWGTPMIFVMLVILLNVYADKNAHYHPKLGHGQCFLTDGYPLFYYFFLPIIFVVGFNIILFIMTAQKIYKIKKETKMLKRTDSRIHSSKDDQQKFKLYLKLMMAMGINWTMEIISWAVEWKYGKDEVPREVFYLTDLGNALYGFFIFLIFVFKKKTWRSLMKRYYTSIGKPHLAPVTSSRSTRTSNYSTDTVVSNDFSVCSTPLTATEEITLHRQL